MNEKKGSENNSIRTNRRIRVPEVFVIDQDGEKRGNMPTQEALRLAEDAGLDLVEVSPSARPPVCRILDFGKYKYLQAKKQKESAVSSAAPLVKEIQVSPRISPNDVKYRIDHAADFIRQKHHVRITCRFKGRESQHQDIGRKVIDDMVAELVKIGAIVESGPRLEGRLMTVQLRAK